MRKLTLVITCTAPLELWTKDFDELSSEQQKLFLGGDIPCAEAGMLGGWCDSCQFGEVNDDER